MPVSPEEQADLDKMLKDQATEREHFSSYVRIILDMKEDDLRHRGHKSIEGALLFASKDHIKKLNKLAVAYYKKWPD